MGGDMPREATMCIKRADMPQVDWVDMPGLFAFLNSKHILVAERKLPPTWLTIRQCLDEVRACRNTLILTKPLLIATDLSVLDGDHRLVAHLELGTPEVECFQIGCSFAEASKAILQYPKAYRLGDGPQPERW